MVRKTNAVQRTKEALAQVSDVRNLGEAKFFSLAGTEIEQDCGLTSDDQGHIEAAIAGVAATVRGMWRVKSRTIPMTVLEKPT